MFLEIVFAKCLMKLNDTNYLVWYYQMRLLLESHEILGFFNGTRYCHTSFDEDYVEGVENEDLHIWKMHDRALMQLLIATLFLTAMSCIIGYTNSHEMWINLKD